MTGRGGYRTGSGARLYGEPKDERFEILMTRTERAEIEAAVPERKPVGRWIVEAAVMRARSGR